MCPMANCNFLLDEKLHLLKQQNSWASLQTYCWSSKEILHVPALYLHFFFDIHRLCLLKPFIDWYRKLQKAILTSQSHLPTKEMDSTYNSMVIFFKRQYLFTVPTKSYKFIYTMLWLYLNLLIQVMSIQSLRFIIISFVSYIENQH